MDSTLDSTGFQRIPRKNRSPEQPPPETNKWRQRLLAKPLTAACCNMVWHIGGMCHPARVWCAGLGPNPRKKTRNPAYFGVTYASNAGPSHLGHCAEGCSLGWGSQVSPTSGSSCQPGEFSGYSFPAMKLLPSPLLLRAWKVPGRCLAKAPRRRLESARNLPGESASEAFRSKK